MVHVAAAVLVLGKGDVLVRYALEVLGLKLPVVSVLLLITIQNPVGIRRLQLPVPRTLVPG